MAEESNPGPNDPQRNDRLFENAMAAMRKIASRQFGRHEGAIMPSSAFQSAPEDAPSPPDETQERSEIDNLLEQASEPIIAAAPADELPEYEPQFVDVMARRESRQESMPPREYNDPTSQSTHDHEYTPEHATDFSDPEVAVQRSSREFEPAGATIQAEPPVFNQPEPLDAPSPHEFVPPEQGTKRGGPAFLRNMASPERPIVEGANPTEPPAEYWRFENEQAPQPGVDPGGKPVERQLRANERQQQETLADNDDAMDEFGGAVENYALRTADMLRQLAQRLNRIEQSLASEGSDYA